MAIVTLMVLSLIIMITVIYIAYKIIKFLFFSSNRKSQDDEDVSETLNNNYRIFRAELYEWESSYKANANTKKREVKRPEIKRKRPSIKRKPKSKPKPRPELKNDDIPRFYPD
jgi:predicted Holliday junction resolvase-like endonuclease